MIVCYNFQSYQLWLTTHQIQIQLVLRITILKKVCHIPRPLNFSRKQRVYFLCDLWEASLLPSNWAYLNLYSSSWFYIFFFQSQLLEPYTIELDLSILESLCKNKPPNIRMVAEARNIRVKNISGGFFTFCKINMYGLECFRCVFHELLSIISLTLLKYGWFLLEL